MKYMAMSYTGRSGNPDEAIIIASAPAIEWLEQHQMITLDGHETYKCQIHLFRMLDDSFVCTITIMGLDLRHGQ